MCFDVIFHFFLINTENGIDFQILYEISIRKINSTAASILSILIDSVYYNVGEKFCFYNHRKLWHVIFLS